MFFFLTNGILKTTPMYLDLLACGMLGKNHQDILKNGVLNFMIIP